MFTGNLTCQCSGIHRLVLRNISSLKVINQTISKEKMTVMTVIDTNPKMKITSAHHSNRRTEFSKRMDKNEDSALTMNSKLSTANALSIK